MFILKWETEVADLSKLKTSVLFTRNFKKKTV